MLKSVAGWLEARRASESVTQRRGLGALALALVAGVVGMGTSEESQAVPAFARQTGMACTACHFQNFPILNSFGRAFKAAGYTLMGSQEKLEDDGLSLPVVLNSSLVTKFRYVKYNGNDTTDDRNTGELQLPDEAALLIGGRAGEHVGFLLEMALAGIAGETDLGTGETSSTNFLSFKMPFTYKVGDTDLSFIPFMTDAAGAGYGMELLNTGALRPQRVGEDRSNLMAQQYLGLGAGAAEGVAFTASNEKGFINLTQFAPHYGNFAKSGLATYLRAAWTPSLGNWDAGVGIQHYSGSAWNGTAKVATKGWAIDGQLQGEMSGMPLGVYAAYGKVPAGSILNGTRTTDWTAWSIHGQLGVIPGKATLIAGYRNGDRGGATGEDNAFTIGGTWQYTQNIQLQVSHAIKSGNRYDVAPTHANLATGDAQTYVMLFSAF